MTNRAVTFRAWLIVTWQVARCRCRPRPSRRSRVRAGGRGERDDRAIVVCVGADPARGGAAQTAPLSAETEPEPVPLTVTVSGNRSGSIVVGSEALLFEALTSPPPETVATFVSDAGAVAATETVDGRCRIARAGASASEREQVAGTSQVQPVPDMPVTVRPAGGCSATVTAPDEEPAAGVGDGERVAAGAALGERAAVALRDRQVGLAGR